MDDPRTDPTWPVVIVGAGAAGLMAAISAARAAPAHRVLVLDGAHTLGAKILVAGGGRCNVTHHTIDHRLYAPASDHGAIRAALRAFTVRDTVAFFESRGVTLKREPSGKLFPTTDSARTILDALLGAARDAGARIIHPWRVGSVERDAATATFTLRRDDANDLIRARTLILAAGGRSLPKTGSDGHAYAFARSLGHSVTRTFPALVPLVVDPNRDRAGLTSLSGVSAVATLEVRAASGKKLHAVTGSTLCTHKGLSGPAPMNVSRHLAGARLEDPDAGLRINWLPGLAMDRLDAELVTARAPVASFLRAHASANPEVAGDGGAPLPIRLAEAICRAADVAPGTPAHALTREQRKAIARAATEMDVPIAGDRGWNHAEVTAGGVPLREIDPKTMRSRLDPNLYLCGEILDVDGPIGGYNFQWAWATGNLAGSHAATVT